MKHMGHILGKEFSQHSPKKMGFPNSQLEESHQGAENVVEILVEVPAGCA